MTLRLSTRMLACAAALMATAPLAHAGEHDAHSGHAMHMMAAPKADKAAAAAPSTQELQHANAAMHKAMDITYTGDADIDFLRGMIAHHQGAVDMAEVQLKYGRDPKVTRLAQEIIRAQNLEISWMQKWLVQLESQPRKPIVTTPRTSGWSDKSWNGKTWMGER